MRAVLLPLVAAMALAIGATSGVSAQDLELPESAFERMARWDNVLLAPDIDDAPLERWYTHISEGVGNAPKGGGAGMLGANAEGTRFIVGFMQNEIHQTAMGMPIPGTNYDQQTISLASRFATTVTLQPVGDIPTVITLKPYIPVTLGVAQRLECFGESVSRKGIEITSDLPISVYVYSAKYRTSDGYLALPVSSWGTQYVSSNYHVDQYTPYGTPERWEEDDHNLSLRHGEFAVIGGQDSTLVTVFPATRTLLGAARMQPYRRLIHKGEIFQVQDGGFNRGGEDLTGSIVSADKPVGFLSGHMRAGIPTRWDTKDHLIEMLPPRNTLGKRYIVVPFGGRQGGDIVRIISAFEGSTQITITNTAGESVVASLPAIGEHYQLPLREVTIITATQPVMVTQYAQSAEMDPRNRPRVTVNFDPDMVVVTPEEQFVNAAVFQTLPNWTRIGYLYKQFDIHYVTVVAEREGFDGMTLDGKRLGLYSGIESGDVPGTPYVWATIPIVDSAEAHVLKGDALFGGYVYGLGEFDSYAWPVGSGLRKFDMPPDTVPPQVRSVELCGVYEYIAQDSGFFASGLRRVRLDSAASTNVDFVQTLLIIGDEISLGRLRLVNPRLAGRARLVAEDLDGNEKELWIDIESTSPVFSRDSIYFGVLDIGGVGRQTLRITNGTARAIILDSVLLAVKRKFLFDNPQTYQRRTLNPGESVDLKIIFGTSERGVHRDTVVISTGCFEYRFPLTAVVPNPGILATDAPFGSVRRGTPKTMLVTVRNTGQATLTVDSARISGSVFSTDFVRPFAAPLLLPAGDDTSFAVTFQPTDVIVYRESITFYSNADSLEVSTLTGRGIYPYLLIGGHDFGKVQVGLDADTTIPFRNIGTDNATVTGVLLETPGGFIVEPFAQPVTVLPEQIVNVPVTFRPDQERAYITKIFLLNEDGLEAEATLEGTGYLLRASIDGCDWGRRWVGTSHDSIRYVRNVGSEPVTITGVDIVNGDVGEFRITDAMQQPVTLQTGDSLPVALQFSPLFTGERSATIQATTTSSLNPVIDEKLLGFGLEAGASDLISLDSSLAYACGTREGEIAIENTGNTDLTLASVTLDAGSPFVKILDAPAPGDLIGAGENSSIKFVVDFAGQSGAVTGRISWSFEQLAGTFTREFTIEAVPQAHVIVATTPPSVEIDGEFNLLVRVDSLFWKDVPEDRITLVVDFNPTVARFDAARWLAFSDTTQSGWVSAGDPLMSDGSVVLNLKPALGARGTLDSVLFFPIPFRAFLGNERLDTFRIRMSAGAGSCAPPSLASIPYAVDSICGLSQRLFVLTGPAYKLQQNTPNPVTLKTFIDFTLGMDAETTLEIFAADGKLIRTLVNEVLAAGDYSIPVDATDLSSGHYFYRLRSGPFSETRQMRITK